jgi:toxin ParE1/3/4
VGGEQREAYLRKITDAVARLEVMPSIGRRRDSLLQGLRSIPVGSHSLYYSQVGDVVYLRHILHNRRDPDLSDWQALAEDLEERPDE